MIRKSIFTLALAIFAMVPLTAQANPITRSGGVAGKIPEGSVNNLLASLKADGRITLDDDGKLDGFYGADLNFSGVPSGVDLVFEFYGFEAGFNNVFQINKGSGFETVFINNPGNLQVGNPFQTEIVAADTFENFRFGINGTTNFVTNNSNPDNDGNTPNFFVAEANDGGWFLFLDDGGAGPDDNHDDMVIRVYATPVPSSLVLLGVAVAGLGGYRLRRRKK